MPAEIKQFFSPEAEKQIKFGLEAFPQMEKSLKDADKAAQAFTANFEKAKNIDTNINKASVATGKLTDQLSSYQAVAKESEALNKQIIKTDAKLKVSREENYKQLVRNQVALQNKRKEVKEEIKLEKAAESSITAKAARLKELREAYDNAAEGVRDEFLPEIQKLDKEIKEARAESGRFQDRVGEYPSAFSKIRQGVDGATKALRVFITNPIVAVVSLIAGALAGLFAAFKKSEKGAQLLAKGTGLLQGLFSQLVKLSVTVFNAITKVFNDPLGAVKDLGNSIKDNILARFEAAQKLAGLVGQAIRQLFKGDFKELKETAKEAGDAVVQIGTGFSGKEIVDGVKGIGDALKETTEEVVNTTNAFINLAAERRNIIKQNREIQKSVGDLQTQEELLSSLADDTTKSIEERNKASLEAADIIEKRAEKEQQIAQNNLSILQQEIRLRRSNGEDVEALLDQELSAFTALQDAQRSYTLAVQDNIKTRNELAQDQLERDLDYLIDAFDNQKTINERRIADDERTFEERQKILDETTALANSSFDEQIKTIQQGTNEQINANELLAISDAKVLAERVKGLKLSDILNGRLLEIIRERKTVLEDLAEAQSDLNKNISEEEKKEIEARAAFAIAEKEREEQAKVNILRAKLADGVISEEQYQSDVRQIRIDSLNEDAARLQALLKIEGITAENRLKVEEELTKTLGDLDNELTDQYVDNKEREKAADEEKLERMRKEAEFLNEFTQLGVDLTNQLYDNQIAKSQQAADEQIANLQKRYDAGLISEDQFEKGKLNIQKKADKEQAKLKRKQAIADKAAALINIAINTAVAISKVLGQTGIFGLAAWIPIAALGALQAGIVAAKPIPTFAGGTESTPDTFIAGEKGRELMVTPSGELVMADKPTLYTGMHGTKVIPNTETELLMAGRDAPASDERMLNEIIGLRNDVRNKREYHIDFRKKTLSDRKGNYWRNYINRMVE